jgi:hypothetical protein
VKGRHISKKAQQRLLSRKSYSDMTIAELVRLSKKGDTSADRMLSYLAPSLIGRQNRR